jgi:hypothetical protein
MAQDPVFVAGMTMQYALIIVEAKGNQKWCLQSTAP